MNSTRNISDNVEERLKMCYMILKQYTWLTNAYVLDFFVENHWDQLLKSWSCFIDQLCVKDLANLLDYNKRFSPCYNTVVPLSLNCLRVLLHSLCLPRNNVIGNSVNPKQFYSNEKLMNLFWKSVKVKKRHEIMEMAKLCYNSAVKSGCFYIVDVGCGLGHLSRILAYGYKFKVLGIEANKIFYQQAKKLDYNFKKCASEYLSDCVGEVQYLNSTINYETNGNDILECFRHIFALKGDVWFGLVGLHPCGDLGALLLKLYRNCENIKFINIASCCYMKLATASSSLKDSFPISYYCQNNKFTLSYNDREVACHAIEMYIDKLLFGQHDELKIHTYRAVLEKLIIRQRPDLRHSHLSNIKYRKDLSFNEYCRKAVVKLGICIKEEIAKSDEVQKDLAEWNRVVKFYTLRLMLAPLIETIILLDRLLFLQETGGTNDIVPAFQPQISPRNHILNGSR